MCVIIYNFLNYLNRPSNLSFLFQGHIVFLTSYLLEWLLSKREEITSVGENVEKMEPLGTVGRNVNWCRKQNLEFPQKIKNRVTL